MATYIDQKKIALINQANKATGFFEEDISADTLTKLQALSEPQQKALFDNMLLLSEQIGFDNLMNPDGNPFRAFLRNAKDNGWKVEEYILEILEGVTPQWDDNSSSDASNLVKTYEQKVKSSVHYTEFSKEFPTTIRNYEFKKSFLPDALGDFIDRKINNLANSAEVYMMIDVFKELLDTATTGIRGDNSQATNITTEDECNNFLVNVLSIKEDFKMPTTYYNSANIISMTRSDDDIYIITTPEIYAKLAVKSYSQAYNLNELKIKNKILFMPNGWVTDDGTGNGFNFIMLDRKALYIAIKMWQTSSFYVANQFKTNYWLGVEGLTGFNNFVNAYGWFLST